MKKSDLTRRDFLTRFTGLGAVALGSGALLSACAGGESQPAAEPEAPTAAADACGDLTGLTDAEVQMRTSLQYVAETPDAAKRCDNCALWVVPEAGSACGGCQLIKGPIAPAGYCASWAPMQTTG